MAVGCVEPVPAVGCTVPTGRAGSARGARPTGRAGPEGRRRGRGSMRARHTAQEPDLPGHAGRHALTLPPVSPGAGRLCQSADRKVTMKNVDIFLAIEINTKACHFVKERRTFAIKRAESVLA